MLKEVNCSQNSIYKIGITLDRYFKQMKTIDISNQQHEEIQEDLYITSQQNNQPCSKFVVNNEIRESQEQSYLSSYDEKIGNKSQKCNNVLISIDKKKQNKYHTSNLSLFPELQWKALPTFGGGFKRRKEFNSQRHGPSYSQKKDIHGSSFIKNTLLKQTRRNQMGLNTRETNQSFIPNGKYGKGINEIDLETLKTISKQNIFKRRKGKEIQLSVKNNKNSIEKYTKICLPEMKNTSKTDRFYDHKNIGHKTLK